MRLFSPLQSSGISPLNFMETQLSFVWMWLSILPRAQEHTVTPQSTQSININVYISIPLFFNISTGSLNTSEMHCCLLSTYLYTALFQKFGIVRFLKIYILFNKMHLIDQKWYFFKILNSTTTVFNINNKKFLEHKNSILKWFLKDYVTLTGVMMLKIQLCHHRNKLHLKIY